MFDIYSISQSILSKLVPQMFVCSTGYATAKMTDSSWKM